MSIQFIQTLIKTSKPLKNFSSIFCIFTDVCLIAIPFSILCTVWRFVFLLPPWDLIPSRGSTYRLVGSSWQVGCLPTQALKCQVNRYMWVKQNLHMASLLSVFTHWGGEPRCHCTIQILISFIVVLLGSIYSQSSVFTHWGVVLLDQKAKLTAKVVNTIGPYST